MENENHNEMENNAVEITGASQISQESLCISGEQVNNENSFNSGEQMNSNPYGQGNAYGQGIYTGQNFATPVSPNPKPKKRKKPSSGKGKKVAGLVLSGVLFGLVAGGTMVGVNYFGNKLTGSEKQASAQVSTVATIDAGSKSESSGNDLADVAEAVMPSIVSITNTSVQTVRSWFQSYEQEVTGSGSGIIIGQDKDSILIVTNNHVIDGAREIAVAFCDETVAAATVKGTDSTADLAVVEVKTADMDEDTLSKIKVAALGSSDELRVGERAIAIGNALGYGQSVTGGYISAVNRSVDTDDTTMKMIQTDAAINPGNSGGALLNAAGEVIGINTIKFVDSQVEGMGYAIPISSAIPIINDLMNHEVIDEGERGYLGIQGNDITAEYAQGFNMPKGVYVVKIVEGSPADSCDLRAGDIITKFAGRDIVSMDNLQGILANKKAGEEVEMIVQRSNEKGEYEEVSLTITLGAKKDMPESKMPSTEETTTENEEMYPYYEDGQMDPDEFFEEFERFFGR